MTTFSEQLKQARADLAAALIPMDADQRVELMIDACIETGGSLVPAGVCAGGAHYAEINCLGIYHSGNDVPEAIASWIKAVHRTECDPCITGDAA